MKGGSTQKRKSNDDKDLFEKCSKIKKSADLTEANKVSSKNERTEGGSRCSGDKNYADVINGETKDKKAKNSNTQPKNERMISYSAVKIKSRIDDGKKSKITSRSPDGRRFDVGRRSKITNRSPDGSRFEADKASRASNPAETDLNSDKNINNEPTELPTFKSNSSNGENVSVHKREPWNNPGITRPSRITSSSSKKVNHFVRKAIRTPEVSESALMHVASLTSTSSSSSSSSSSKHSTSLTELPVMSIERISDETGSAGFSSPHQQHHHHIHHHHHNHNHHHHHYHNHYHSHYHGHCYYYYYDYD